MPRKTSAVGGGTVPALIVFVLALALGAGAAWFCHKQSHLLRYGDGLAHLNIARRVIDSRTPGPEQIGTVWLPLPHLLMLPFVRDDGWWRSGVAGSIPAVGSFAVAVTFLFAAVRRALHNGAAAAAAACTFALNPNVLYLQSVPMTEAIFAAGLATLLYFTIRYSEGANPVWAAAAGGSLLWASLTRYEGWFLIPFAGAFILLTGGKRSRMSVALFAAFAMAGVVAWLAHNLWYYSNPLEFYSGPYSAKAIYQRALDAGMARYPGDGDWSKALLHFSSAAELCAGTPLFWMGLAGTLAALVKRAWWAVLLLALPGVFYVWSMYSSGTPIFVPSLWPNSYYNTRYGLALLPLLALGVAGLVALAPVKLRTVAALVSVVVALLPWVVQPDPAAWITWKEAAVNSEARRAWTIEAAAFLSARASPRDRFICSFGDLTGIFVESGIPLARTLHEGNGPAWDAAIARPDLFLWEDWAVANPGDRVATAILKASRTGPRYRLEKTITVKGAAPVEIWKREGPGKPPPLGETDADSLHEGTRGAQ